MNGYIILYYKFIDLLTAEVTLECPWLVLYGAADPYLSHRPTEGDSKFDMKKIFTLIFKKYFSPIYKYILGLQPTESISKYLKE
jgi:hypothetical protein